MDPKETNPNPNEIDPKDLIRFKFYETVEGSYHKTKSSDFAIAKKTFEEHPNIILGDVLAQIMMANDIPGSPEIMLPTTAKYTDPIGTLTDNYFIIRVKK